MILSGPELALRMSINTQFELVGHLTEWAYTPKKETTTADRLKLLQREKKVLDAMLVDLHAERSAEERTR